MLDAAKIPHGDMSVPSKIVHSRRYLISQWQRSAIGACVMILGMDDNADICVAVGNQRGLLRHPQGYMEVGHAHPNPLPFDPATIEQLNTALQAIGYTELSVCDEPDSGMSSLRP